MATFIKLNGTENHTNESYSILVNIDNIVSIGKSLDGKYTLLSTINNTILRVSDKFDDVTKLCGYNQKNLMNG